MDLRQLRYFVAVAEEGHITRAAERLGMQQPPLSQQIKAIEQELDLQLFRRKARGVELTDAGRVLLDQARGILERLDQRTARGEQGRLCVGIAPTAPFHPFVPHAIRAFREAYPLVSLTLEECLSKQAIERLRGEQIDVAFLRAPVADPQGLAVHHLLDEPMVVALPRSHALAGRDHRSEPIRLRVLAEETFIVFGGSAGPGIADASLAACHRAGFNPRLGQQAPRIASTLGLVSAGLGVALVPASIQRVQVDGVAYRRLLPRERPTAVLNFALRRDDPSVVVRNFLDLVRRVARDERWIEEELDEGAAHLQRTSLRAPTHLPPADSA
jgi:DNA-binding transcriptional LysR family regulator